MSEGQGLHREVGRAGGDQRGHRGGKTSAAAIACYRDRRSSADSFHLRHGPSKSGSGLRLVAY
ncbi:hypothetical protein PABG_12116 [Paracoccidioides brasiliensis Pb03]|uniref:Uncharacterized protein n=1 Tax=Paracoccidioides brasiliensis (strain Pb18) TaxID=502780 RepID=A0A0A0HTN6_PARBD|nr:uncharacterized protein PADG_12233 [Paracoccidioides brasiliensis Pb18]KGM91663.1 hypothetical protein PADG_12233 [Paracoccidioides brasiliensis Pb18]KGY15002.1 hypothetical protein PABG_12116 [Paracoccidioides brasiliensis Pb03]ODH51822.1 hypothetical protein GX48_02066 [Paracoccidioides brasiliensis]